MSFTIEDEAEFQRCRDELGRDFAAWAEQHHVAADPGDAQLLLDWKWGYADGELGRWRVPDVEEFLLEWCPRKLSSPPDLCAEIPLSVAAFMDFLAHRDLLAPGSQPPAALRRYCEQVGPRFQREMADPANFGMAKSMLDGGFGGGSGADQAALLARLQELTGTDPEELLELLAGGPPEPLGPVRLPSPAAQLAALRAAPTFRQVRALAERCPAPGLAVTTQGHPRLADARRLVTELDTGDEPEPTLSVTELPELIWVVELAVAAGAVVRHADCLVAGPEFAELTETEMYRRLVRAAIELGLRPSPGTPPGTDHLDPGSPALLAELLHAYVDGEPASVGELTETVLELDEADEDADQDTTTRIAQQLSRLRGLGVVQESALGPQYLELTAAGVSAAVELVDELLDVEVIVRPDSATADAATLADPLLLLDREEAEADLGAWFAAQPDPAAAATELLSEIIADTRAAGEVLVGLDLAGAVLGGHAETAARPHQDGPHAPLVLTWLLGRGVLDPADVDPHDLMFGMVTVAATMMDLSGPEGAVEFVLDSEREQVLTLLDQIWRLEHPRLAEVLDAIGRLHPDKKVAKEARRSLMRHRSYATR